MMEKNNVRISFYLRESAIRMHRKMLDSIGNPTFIEFLISDDGKNLAVRSSKEKSLRTFRARINGNRKTDKVEFYSQYLCNFLAQTNNWDQNGSYRIYGNAFFKQGLAIFDLSNSEII